MRSHSGEAAKVGMTMRPADSRAWLSYNSPVYLQARHKLPQELVQNIAVIETIVAKAGE